MSQRLDADLVDPLAGLVDPARLAAWLDDRLPGAGEPLGVERITSGASNEVFVLRRADAEWVLRRPARGAAPSETMAREFRVLTALEGTPVPHPTPLALCEDAEVLGAPFYVMDRIDGFTPRIPLPAPFDGDAAARHDMGAALVDVLGDLACVDWRAGGLEGFGKPEGYVERQVDRWFGVLDRADARAARCRRRRGVATRAHADRGSAGPAPRRLPVRQRDVRQRPPGAHRRGRRLGAVDDR